MTILNGVFPVMRGLPYTGSSAAPVQTTRSIRSPSATTPCVAPSHKTSSVRQRHRRGFGGILAETSQKIRNRLQIPLAYVLDHRTRHFRDQRNQRNRHANLRGRL